MRRDKDIRQIALQISIALSAGVFSIMPSASAAPVLDHVVSGGAVVDQKTSPQVTDVTSNTRNNVIDWKDFSVSQGETVRFDKGEKINNYLNVVSGVNTSHIDGAIKGGDNVYIVNPNGVVFGNFASVDVGSLYVSSRPLDDVNYTKVDSNGDMQPLADTASMKGGDIVNMGSVQANSVFVEGGNIIITDVDKIKTADGSAVNNNVTIQTEGKITLARDINTVIAEQKAQEINTSKIKTDSISFASVADGANSQPNANALGSNYTYTFGDEVDSVTSINNESGLYNLATQVTGSAPITGNYMLTTDLNFKDKPFAPIGSDTNVFSGNFDGQYHTVSGIVVSGGSYGGLFGYTSGAKIENIGVTKSDISAKDYAGGIAGHAEKTDFINVFNDASISVTKNAGLAGGIVGYAKQSTIKKSYNTGSVTGKFVGGIAGRIDHTQIDHVYNTYKKDMVNGVEPEFNGIVFDTEFTETDNDEAGYAVSSIDHSYTKSASSTSENYSSSKGKKNALTSASSYNLSDYTEVLGTSNISNKGGETDKIWRIYEGQDTPYLRDFLTAHGTVKVNYEYKQGATTPSVSNNGGDISIDYNNNNIDISKVNYIDYQTGNKVEDDDGLITAPTSVDGNVVGPVTATQDPNDPTKTIYTGKMKAAFYTGQQGYDLIGNNITINPRQVTINSSDVVVKPITKEYDSTNDASAALQNLSFGAASGIIDGDTTVSITPSADSTAVFLDSSPGDGDAADVGNNKTVQVSASVTLKNADGYYNYVMADDAQATISQTITGNKITQKAVTISLKDDGSDGEGINKEYDGTDVVTGTAYLPSAQIDSTQSVTLKDRDGNEIKTETLTIIYADTANYEDSKAGAYVNKVKYGGIKIKSVSDSEAKNYKLVDADNKPIYRLAVDDNDVGVNVEDGGAIYGTGHITKKNISSKGFSWYDGSTKMDATREYNRESTFTEYTVKDSDGNIVKDADGNDVVINIAGKYLSNCDAVENTDYTLGDGEKFGRMLSNENLFTIADVNGVADAGFITTLSKGGSSATDVTGTNGAQGVLYTVNVSQSAKDNYTLDNADITTDKITLVGKGSITPRTLNLVHNTSDAARAVKAYDGDAKVKRGTQESFYTINGDSDFLIYADNTDNKHHLLPGDENAVTITGKYYNGTEEDANVNYANGQVLDKKIVYTATVASGNYIIVNKDANTTTGTFTVDLDTNNAGMGRITQREINQLVFKNASKTYDGDAAVTNSKSAEDATFKTDDVITITGALLSDGSNALVSNDTVATVFNTIGSGDNALITGQYGIGTGANWTANENAGDKVVQYTLKNGLLKNNNYKLTTGNTVEGTGTIEQLTITPEDIKLARNSKAITDVYDGTGNVDTPTQYLNYVDGKAARVVKDGKTLNVGVNVNEASYATIHSKNKADQIVTYSLTLTDDSAGNYVVKNGNTVVSTLLVSKDANGKDIKGVITPRPITIYTSGTSQNVSDNLTKTYDARTAAKVTGEDLISIESQLVNIDKNKNRNGITADYAIPVKDADGKITGYTTLDKNASNTTKAVVYTLAIDPTTGGGDASDYYFRMANSDTPITEYVGAGTINPLRMQVGLVSGVNPSKVFDGTANVPTDKMPTFDQYTFTEVDEDGNSLGNVKSVVDEDGFDTNIANVTGLYGYYDADNDNEFVKDSNVADKVVKYTGVLNALGTANAGNYIVEDTFYGTGKITPATIDENAFKFALKDNIIKTYSGDSAVAEYGMTDAQKEAFQRSWVDGGNDDKTGSGVLLTDGTFIKLSDGAYKYTIVNTPKFMVDENTEAVNAGGDKAYTVTYSIEISPESFANYTYEPTSGSGLTPTTPIPKTAKTNGTIVKRIIEVEPAKEKLTKTYDGTTTIYNNDNPTWSGDTDNNNPVELKGENALKFTSGAAAYDSSQSVQKGIIESNITNASTGAYTSPDASTAAEIVYTGKIMVGNTDITSNYTFEGTTTTNKNVINPFGISVKPNSTSKIFDNTTGVTQTDALAALSGTGVLGEKPSAATADAVAWATGVITANTAKYDDPNVNGGANHVVTYSGLKLSSNNYKLVAGDGSALAYDSSTETYSVDGMGTISPLELNSIVLTATDAVKVYDGNQVVKNADGTATDKTNNYITAFTVNGENWKNNISYAAQYNNENVNGDTNVTYTLGMGKKDNYIISSTASLGEKLQTTADGQYQWVETHEGDKINPRELVVNKASDITKVYNGNSLVKDADNKFFLSPDDMAVLTGDGITKKVVAKYVEADGETEHINASTNPIKVKYTVTLEGNTNGNYSLTGASGTDVTGTITPRPVKVSFVSSEGKVYNGSDTVTDKGTFKLEKEGTDRGIISDDEGKLQVDTSGVTATFADSGNVKRDSSGKVNAQTINYSGTFAVADTTIATNLSGNYVIDDSPTTGEGVITPKKLKLTLNEQPNKEYDGNTTIKNSTIIGTTIANGNTALDNTAIETGDTINVKIASGAYANAGAGTNKTYSYTVNWDNGNYVIVQDYTDTASTTKSAQIKGTNGIITPRELQVTVVGKAEKEYDGTEAVKNAGNYVVVNTDRIVSGDNIKLTVTGVYDNADAGKNDESDEPADHTVTYTLNLGNSNYTLDKYTATGDGVINRKTVTVEAKPVSVDVGQSMPKFSGSVKGLLDGENYLGSWLTYGPPAGVSTATPGQYAVYGWYRGNSSGVLGKNYIFEQSPANATAFTVNYVNTNTGNPDTKITPNSNIYHQISKDMNSGFGDNGAAAIEYKDKSGKVLGTEKIDSGEINSKPDDWRRGGYVQRG